MMLEMMLKKVVNASLMLRRRMKRMIMLTLQKIRWRLMMLRVMRSRGRKVMMLRRVRTRPDPKTGNHLQVKCHRPRPATTLRASLRSPNARQQVTTAGNLQVRGRTTRAF